MGSDVTYPVRPSITVRDSDDIYKTEDWWKAALRYSTDSSENWIIAIYLWHKDGGGWTQKNKYNIKSVEAWQMDVEIIDSYLSTHPREMSPPPDLPVSDYYSVAAGETILNTDEWWKAIVVIDEKGSWETFEVIIYLWQKVEGKWRRRQKYAIKDEEDWLDDREAVSELLQDVSSQPITPSCSFEQDEPVEIDMDDSPVVRIANELGIESAGPEDLSKQLAGVHLIKDKYE